MFSLVKSRNPIRYYKHIDQIIDFNVFNIDLILYVNTDITHHIDQNNENPQLVNGLHVLESVVNIIGLCAVVLETVKRENMDT